MTPEAFEALKFGEVVRVIRSGKLYQCTRAWQLNTGDRAHEFRQIVPGRGLYGRDFLKLKPANVVYVELTDPQHPANYRADAPIAKRAPLPPQRLVPTAERFVHEPTNSGLQELLGKELFPDAPAPKGTAFAPDGSKRVVTVPAREPSNWVDAGIALAEGSSKALTAALQPPAPVAPATSSVPAMDRLPNSWTAERKERVLTGRILRRARQWKDRVPCPPSADEPELHTLWVAVEMLAALEESREPVIEGDQTPRARHPWLGQR
jgi:hypothetical protein